MKFTEQHYCHVQLTLATFPLTSVHMLLETRSPDLPHDFVELFELWPGDGKVIHANNTLMHWCIPGSPVYIPIQSLDLIISIPHGGMTELIMFAKKATKDFITPPVFLASDDKLRDWMHSTSSRRVAWLNASREKKRPYMLLTVKESAGES